MGGILVKTLAERDENDCDVCKYLASTFEMGLNKTSKLHFGGGNTDWEERKLGAYKKSESRFVEIMEFVCDKSLHSEDNLQLKPIKNLHFKCQSMAEQHEGLLEDWFFNQQVDEPDLTKHFCVEQIKACCMTGFYGQDCLPCPGTPKKDGIPCFGRGKCKGSGYRSGSGTCKCDDGYTGKMCSNCASSWFPVSKNETFIECKECFDGCASGCNSEGPKGCNACRSGYSVDSELGCVDIDECENPDTCRGQNEKCINIPGSYNCDCKDGFKKDLNSGQCELDIEGKTQSSWLGPAQTLRIVAIFGLISISTFVLSYQRSTLTVTLTIFALLSAIFIDIYHGDLIESFLAYFLI